MDLDCVENLLELRMARLLDLVWPPSLNEVQYSPHTLGLRISAEKFGQEEVVVQIGGDKQGVALTREGAQHSGDSLHVRQIHRALGSLDNHAHSLASLLVPNIHHSHAKRQIDERALRI